MKIIHCSDIHLDSALGSNFSAAQAKERNAELCATFARMVAFAVRQQVSAVLIAGDLFDSQQVSAQTAHFVLEQIRGASAVTFFYIRGNHEESRDAFFGMQLPENIKTFGNSWKSVRCGHVVITAMEPEGSGWLDMYGQLELRESDVNILMLHGQVSTQPGAEQIALPLLRGKHIRYLALGHLHSYQKERLDMDGEYCYCGCLEGRGFDECGEKGFVLLETDDSGFTSRFAPFGSRTLHEVRVDITQLETVTQILSAMKQASAHICDTDLVKFTLCGAYTLQTQKDLVFLQKMLAPDFYHVRIRDESRLRIDPEGYACDVSLKGEFIRLVLASARSDEEKEKIISCGIRALMGEEVTL